MADGTFTQEQVDALIAERLAAETEGLKKNQAELLREAKAAKARLAAYDGIDPEEHRRLKAAAEDAERKRLAGEGDYKALERQLIERHAKELEARDARNTALTRALERELIDAAAAKAIAEAKGSVKGLLPHVKPHIRVAEVDGEFVAQVVDSKGNQRIGDAKGTLMTIPQLVEEFKGDSDLARLFEGSGSSGGGAPKSTGGAGGGARSIVAGDARAWNANLADIAKGNVEVVQ